MNKKRIGHCETHQSNALNGLRDLHPYAYPKSMFKPYIDFWRHDNLNVFRTSNIRFMTKRRKKAISKALRNTGLGSVGKAGVSSPAKYSFDV